MNRQHLSIPFICSHCGVDSKSRTMNQLFYPVLCVAVFMLAQSCTVTSPVSSSKTSYSSKKATAKSRFVTESSISETPLVTDLVVEEKKVSGSFSGKNINEEEAKNIAVFDALKRAGAEILVEPLFEIQINDDDISVKVEGYPARYNNFRKPTHEDSLALGLIAPPKDTVVVEIETIITENNGGGCCCCGNNSSNGSSSGKSNQSKEISTTIYDRTSAPATGATPFHVTPAVAPVEPSQPIIEVKPDIEKVKAEYRNEYKRLKKKGNTQIAFGCIFITFLPVSIPLLIAGPSNKKKAKRLKQEAAERGIEITQRPMDNPFLAGEITAVGLMLFQENQ